MSISNNELLADNFRELLHYVSNLGEHINQIYNRIAELERNISEAKEELDSSLSENKNELERVKESLVTKTDFANLLQKLNKPFEQFSPPPHSNTSSEPRHFPQTKREEQVP